MKLKRSLMTYSAANERSFFGAAVLELYFSEKMLKSRKSRILSVIVGLVSVVSKSLSCKLRTALGWPAAPPLPLLFRWLAMTACQEEISRVKRALLLACSVLSPGVRFTPGREMLLINVGLIPSEVRERIVGSRGKGFRLGSVESPAVVMRLAIDITHKKLMQRLSLRGARL